MFGYSGLERPLIADIYLKLKTGQRVAPVIAHRLPTIRRCDHILVLEGGRVIEDGTYDELIKKNGYFAGLVERQQHDTAE